MRYIIIPLEAIKDLTERDIRKLKDNLVLTRISYALMFLSRDCLKTHLGKGASQHFRDEQRYMM
jgi:hypothetical protein